MEEGEAEVRLPVIGDSAKTSVPDYLEALGHGAVYQSVPPADVLNINFYTEALGGAELCCQNTPEELHT